MISDTVSKLCDCPVCYDMLKYPATLECGHTMCMECIDELGKFAYIFSRDTLKNHLIRKK